jgi:hypothetical protein
MQFQVTCRDIVHTGATKAFRTFLGRNNRNNAQFILALFYSFNKDATRGGIV